MMDLDFESNLSMQLLDSRLLESLHMLLDVR